MGPRNHVLDGGPDPTPWEGAILGNGESHCKVCTFSTVICAKTAEPIKMPFRFWARMGPRNHVLDGDLQVLRDVAMATTCGTKIALTGFV